MRNKIIIRKIVINKRFMPLLMLGILLCALCMGSVGLTASAETASNFIVEANLLVSTGNTYDVSLTATNIGKDWEGTVRLADSGNGYGRLPVAYDTMLALPQGSTKQFVVKIPKDSIGKENPALKVIFLDKRSRVTAEVDLTQFRWNETDVLPMGILSDDYSALTYLDMGGARLYYYHNNYPIRLMELNQDNLADSLDSLTFLVIDNYNTGILSDEVRDSVNDWVLDGGVLIMGTGSRAEEVLSGIDNLDISCDKIYAPGEYEGNTEEDWDVTKLAVAELRDEKLRYNSDSYGFFMLRRSSGNGAVGVLPYSLSDFGKLRKDAYINGTQEDVVMQILEMVSNEASSRYTSRSSDANYSRYFFREVFGALGFGDTRLNFGALRSLVVLYVIFVGPVLYVILRSVKKRELYWLTVPVAALVGILLVSLAGRGFEVKNTRVYSVTVSDLSRRSNTRTYLRCYDVGHDEWSLQLAEGYESIGPVGVMWNYSGHNDYYYHVKKEGERLFFGIEPDASFEDCYFLTGNAASAAAGSLVLSNLSMPDTYTHTYTGTVSNNTEWDFPYIAVIAQDHLTVYKDLSAGAVKNLKDLEVAYDTSWGPGVSRVFLSEVLQRAYYSDKKDLDILAALGPGIYQAYPEENEDAVVVLGVVRDWEKTVDDDCREISFGCLYQIQ